MTCVYRDYDFGLLIKSIQKFRYVFDISNLSLINTSYVSSNLFGINFKDISGCFPSPLIIKGFKSNYPSFKLNTLIQKDVNVQEEAHLH